MRARRTGVAASDLIQGDFADGFGRRMLASLPRSDQRLKGERYIEGLLSVPGRKTMRAIAAATGEGAAEQSVHHFISKSSWDWSQVRRTLAQYLDHAITPKAWVVRPLAIPKWGRHSVGVQHSYVAALGRVANSQLAYGVWAANESVSVPINWQLMLPSGWLGDDERRRRAEIPEGLTTATADRTLLSAVSEVAGEWGLNRRPVVLDARDVEDLPALVDEMRGTGVPFVMRIRHSVPLAPAEARLAGRGAAAEAGVGAGGVLQRARASALPVRWMEGETLCAGRVPVAVRVPVVVPGPGRGPVRAPLALVGAWGGTTSGPSELWLSNLFAAPAGDILRLGRLIQRVETDVLAIGSRVGIGDFEGRCYGGWHRHVTLCSVAHAMVALSPSAESRGHLLSA